MYHESIDQGNTVNYSLGAGWHILYCVSYVLDVPAAVTASVWPLILIDMLIVIK